MPPAHRDQLKIYRLDLVWDDDFNRLHSIPAQAKPYLGRVAAGRDLTIGQAQDFQSILRRKHDAEVAAATRHLAEQALKRQHPAQEPSN